MTQREFIQELVKKVGAAEIRKSIRTLCSAMPSDGKIVLGGVAIGLASLTGGGLFVLALLAGGAALQLAGTREQQEQQKRKQLEEFEKLAQQVEGLGGNADDLAELLTPFILREDHFLARLPGYEKAELAQRVAADVKKELSSLLPEGADRIAWDDVALFLNQNNELLVSISGMVRDIHAGVGRIEDGQQIGNEMLKRVLALLEARGATPRSIDSASDAPLPLPLSKEDWAILEAAKPFADALTRYRIAVAEGEDAEAGELEPVVEELRADRRVEEDFLFERARGDRHFGAGRFDAAVPAYRAALSARPEDNRLLSQLAVSLMRSRSAGDYGAVLREAEQLLSRAAKAYDHCDRRGDLDSTTSQEGAT